MKHLWQISFKYIFQSKKRSLLIIMSIVFSISILTYVGTALMTIRDIVSYESNYSYGYNQASFLDTDYESYKKIKLNMMIDDLVIVKRKETIDSIKKEDKEFQLNSFSKSLTMLGVREDFKKVDPFIIKEGRFPNNSNEIALEKRLLDKQTFNIEIGDTLTLVYHDRDGTTDFKDFVLVGTLKRLVGTDSKEIACAFVGLEEADLNTGLDLKVFTNRMVLDNNKIYEIGEKFGLDSNQIEINFNSNQTLSGTNIKTVDIYIFIIAGIVFIIIGLSSFGGIYTVFNISYENRLTQYGILRAIGATKKQIKNINQLEVLVISTLSIPLGMLAGLYLIKLTFAPGVDQLYGYVVDDYSIAHGLRVYPGLLIAIALISLFTIYISVGLISHRKFEVLTLDMIRQAAIAKRRKNKTYPITRFLFGIEGYIAKRNIDRTRSRFILSSIAIAITITIFVTSIYLVNIFSRDLMNKADNIASFTRTVPISGQDYMLEKDRIILGENRTVKNISTYIEEYVSLDFYSKNKDLVMTSGAVENAEDFYTLYGTRFLILKEDDIRKYFQIDDETINKSLENKEAMIFVSGVDKSNQDFMSSSKIGLGMGHKKYLEMEAFFAGNLNLSKENSPLNKKYSNTVIIIPDSIIMDRILNGEYKDLNYTMQIEIYEDDRYENIQMVEREIRTMPGYYVNKYQEKMRGKEQAKYLKDNLYTISLLLAASSILNTVNTISSNIIEKKKEISLLRIVGATNKSFSRMISLEAAYHTILGNLTGLFVSFLMCRFIYYASNQAYLEGYSFKAFLLNEYPFYAFLPIAMLMIAVVYMVESWTMKNVLKDKMILNMRE